MSTSTPILQLVKPVDAENVDVDILNDNMDKLEAFADMATFFAFLTNSTNIANGVWQKLAIAGNIAAEPANAGITQAGDRVTPGSAGWYLIIASVEFQVNGVGGRGIAISKNSAGAVSLANTLAFTEVQAVAAVDPSIVYVTALSYFNGTTDYVEFFARQQSGAGLLLTASAGRSHYISLCKLGV